jgi:hypothetical protein
MARRIVVRIEVSPAAKDRLGELSHRHGMTQVALTSRLIEWFTGTSDLIQAAVLGAYPEEIRADVAKLILKRMSKGDSEGKES